MSEKKRTTVSVLYEIRCAVGDPEGKLMQDELVERINRMRFLILNVHDANNGEERPDLNEAIKSMVEKLIA